MPHHTILSIIDRHVTKALKGNLPKDIVNSWFFAQTHCTDYFIDVSAFRREKMLEMSSSSLIICHNTLSPPIWSDLVVSWPVRSQISVGSVSSSSGVFAHLPDFHMVSKRERERQRIKRWRKEGRAVGT